jgi:cytochrome b561
MALIPALLAIGGLFVAHIPKGWSHRHQRVAGLALSALLAVLVATGYLLYYAGGETLREWSGLVHWTLGLAVPAVFIWHYVNGWRRRSRNGR